MTVGGAVRRLGPMALMPFLAAAMPLAAQAPGMRPLFDGTTLKGWEGSAKVWRIVDGAVVGGSLKKAATQSEYLCTVSEFGDFELRVSARLRGAPNGGVTFRSQRVPGSSEVWGYQADIGFMPGEWLALLSDARTDDPTRPYPLWGSLLDAFRPDSGRYPNPAEPYRLIAVADRAVVDKVLRPEDWNEVVVIAEGPRIRIALNGVTTVDFIEKGRVPLRGRICLQTHEGVPSEAWYRDVTLRTLDAR